MRQSFIIVVVACLLPVRQSVAGEPGAGNAGASEAAAFLQYIETSPVRDALSLAQACCKVCRKGKACGDSCIARNKTCAKPPGCACNAQ